MIDYDGAQHHRSAAALQNALQKDKQRLLQNWQDNATLQQQLREAIAT
ncbi:MAG TPA: hypothetical protein PKZ68_02545 [Pseudomonadales bacterium]|nr:hypothetical protein [Pseudomonadales bacterium]